MVVGNLFCSLVPWPCRLACGQAAGRARVTATDGWTEKGGPGPDQSNFPFPFTALQLSYAVMLGTSSPQHGGNSLLRRAGQRVRTDDHIQHGAPSRLAGAWEAHVCPGFHGMGIATRDNRNLICLSPLPKLRLVIHATGRSTSRAEHDPFLGAVSCHTSDGGKSTATDDGGGGLRLVCFFLSPMQGNGGEKEPCIASNGTMTSPCMG